VTEATIVTELPVLRPRSPDSHKGTFGKVLIVAGSRGMSGAAILSGLGALRGGAGLVQVAVPVDVLHIVAGYNPCYLTASLPQDVSGKLSSDAEEIVLELAAKSTVLALGPGLGQSDAITHLVKVLLDRAALPIVLDADGLNAVAQLWTAKPRAERPPRQVPLILTPHPGEFARLLNDPTADVQTNREQLAVKFAREREVILVLKGHRTLVTDGRRLYRNTTGNPGMATGGTGDVLTGLIAALVAQKLEAFHAAQLGVFLHGLAGDLALAEKGEVSLIATDVADYLPQAFGRLGDVS
jgi:ADP-dependent NAD(P)H-hydrate dehydratase